MTFGGSLDAGGVGQLASGFSDLARTTDVVEDALLRSAATVRLNVKNRLVVRALRDGGDYDETWLLMAASLEYVALAIEKDGEVTRLDAAIRVAKAKRGRGEHPSDYRAVDVPTLKRRRKTLRRLASRLRAAGEDEEALRSLISDARAGALDDIATAIRGGPPSRATGAESAPHAHDRAAVLAALLLDLAALRPVEMENGSSDPSGPDD